MAFLGVKPEAEPPEGMERAEPCRLFIQQEIYRGIESGEKPAPASRKISAWLEEHLHLLINARSIEQAFRRRQARLHQQKSATKVAKPKPKATERNWLQEAQEYREKIMERRRTESVERLITEIDMRVAECKACMLCSAPISPNWKPPKKI